MNTPFARTELHYPAPSPRERMSYIALSGTLDIYTMRSAAEVIRATSADRIVLDLSGVSSVGATFIGELVRLRKRLPNSSIELVGGNRFVKRILSLVNVEAILRKPVPQREL